MGASPRDPMMPRAMTIAPVRGSRASMAHTRVSSAFSSATWRPASSAVSPQPASRSAIGQAGSQADFSVGMRSR